VLANVLLKAEEGLVELASTDMEVSLRVPLDDAGVEEHGADGAAPPRCRSSAHAWPPAP